MKDCSIPARVLIVEDNAIDAAHVESLLHRSRRLRPECEVVGFLSNALQALQSRAYDVVLLDLGLPDSSGVDTAFAVVNAAPTVPVIALSGREDLETAETAVRAGAAAFVVKDINLHTDALERHILSALERARQETQSRRLALEAHSRTGQSLPERHVAEPHLRRVEEAIGAAEVYLARNAPSHYEEARSILDRAGLYRALRELRSLLELEEQRKQRRPSGQSYQALRARAASEPPIRTPAAARSDLAAAVVDWNSELWADDDG